MTKIEAVTPEMQESRRNYTLEAALHSGFARRVMAHLDNGVVRDDLIELLDTVRRLSVDWERIWSVTHAAICHKSPDEYTARFSGNVEAAIADYEQLRGIPESEAVASSSVLAPRNDHLSVLLAISALDGEAEDHDE